MTDTFDEARARELEARLEPIGEALRHSDFARASRLAAEALRDGFEHPGLYSLRALGLEQEARLEEALADLRRAVELAPHDFTAFNALGLCLMRLNRLADAISAFREAVRVGPGFPPAHYNLGRACEQLGRLVEAVEAYGEAVRLNADYLEPAAALCELALRRGDLTEARRWSDHAVAAQADHPRARLAVAGVALAGKDAQAATVELERLLADGRAEPLDRSLGLGLLGDALDALDHPADAFAAWTACNQQVRALYAGQFEGESVADMLVWLTDFFRKAPAAPWIVRSEVRPVEEVETHAFLLSFPRSGTTLLEHALGGHPDVATMEERETLIEVTLDFMVDAGDLEVLQTAEEDRLDIYRRAYWKRVKGFGFTPGRRVFIDKQPLNTIRLPLIAKLFPRAKILFALRDPRDVVLSAFRHRFQVNAANYETLDLVRCARFYNSVMTLRDLYRSKLGYDEHVTVYEQLVQSFEAETAAVCRFLGIDWNEEIMGFAARAQAGRVATVSGAQVARGLYQSGAGQWRRYARELEPALPILKPWVERFGYPPE